MPTLEGILQWVKTQGTMSIMIALIGLAVRFFFKQQIGKMVGLLALAGFVLLIISNPDSIIKAVQAIFSKVVGGNGQTSI